MSMTASAQGGQPWIHDPSTIMECGGKYYTFGTGGGGLISEDGWNWYPGAAGYAQTLLLTARDICASLFYIFIVLIGETLNILVCLREAACLIYLFIGRVFLAPAHIIFDSSGEQNIFLQNNRDLMS